MNLKKGITGGIVAGIILIVVNFISGMLLSNQYEMTNPIWKTMTGYWQYEMFALNIFDGILYGLVFSVLYNGIPGNGWKKGLYFGLILWIVATIPGMLITYMSMAVPDIIILSWIVNGLIGLVLGSTALAVVYEKV